MEEREKHHSPRRWGTVIKRTNADGQVTAYVARYVNPINKKKKVGKQFKPEFLAQAYAWLDEEHCLVTMHEKGIQQWTPPAERNRKKAESEMVFEEWVKTYFHKRLEKKGRMRGRTMRRTKLAVGRLMPYFHGMPLKDITEDEVEEWRRKAKKEIPSPDGYDKASFMLKRLMRAAVCEGLKNDNPCKYSTPNSKPKKEDVRPLSKHEVKAVAEAFPEYTRLAVWLSVLVGGLRIGEICGLQLQDIDFDHTLRATHATLFMVEGGTLKETMDELGHRDIKIAVGYYQRVIPEHQREVTERLAAKYLPMDDNAEMMESAIGELDKRIKELEGRKEELETRLDDLASRAAMYI